MQTGHSWQISPFGGAGPVLNSHTFLVWLSRGLFKNAFGIASIES